jgi:hypothetical protein
MEQMFRVTIGARIDKWIRTDLALQEAFLPPGRVKPWGTLHAVLAASRFLSSPFAVVNADDFYGRRSFEIMSHALDATAESNECSLIGFRLDQTLSEHGPVTRGVCRVGSEGYITSIVETKGIRRRGSNEGLVHDRGCEQELTGDEIASLNFWGFHPSIVNLFEDSFAAFLTNAKEDAERECLLPTTIAMLVAQDLISVKVLASDGGWFGLTHPEDKVSVVRSIRALIDAGVYPAELWKLGKQRAEVHG